jgi:hypothetical protein
MFCTCCSQVTNLSLLFYINLDTPFFKEDQKTNNLSVPVIEVEQTELIAFLKRQISN